MAQIFNKVANKVPTIILTLAAIFAVAGVGFFWYFGSPKFTDVGYAPEQPIPFSHKLHAGDLGLDCRYCHYQIEFTNHANIPPTSVCMNCHTTVGLDLPSLDLLRESAKENKPLEWIRVHSSPDFVYFNHSAHINAGVSCVSCHGNVAAMPVVTQKEPLSMSWCLDCHNNPDPHIRPMEFITDMTWEAPADNDDFVKVFKQEKKIKPSTDCTACHR